MSVRTSGNMNQQNKPQGANFGNSAYQQQQNSNPAVGIGNRQPIKQLKPSPRVGMATGNNNIQASAGQTGSGMPMRPGTAGATGISANRGQGPVGSQKGFQDRMGGGGPYHQGNAQ